MPKVVPGYKEKAKKRILKVATVEFAKRGYRNVTMNDVAEKVGVSKAAVYHYFDSKKSLVAAVATSLVENAFRNGRPGRRNKSILRATEDSLGNILEMMPGFLPGMPCDFISETHDDEGAWRSGSIIERMLLEKVVELWEAGKKEGEIPSNLDTTRIVRGLLALQLGLLTEVSEGLPRQQAIEAWIEITHRVVTSLESGKA
jgi:AcrR family transcriptional regulator